MVRKLPPDATFIGDATVAVVPSMDRGAVGLVVPMPTLPALVTTKFVAVEEPMANAGPLMPFGFTDSSAHGVVLPMPTEPASVTARSVVEALLTTWKGRVFADVSAPQTVSAEYGDVVPTPTLPPV